MHCGVMVTGYNQGDWERLLAEDYSRPPAVSDAANMDDTLELGELVEPLGFDSIWATEHYGSAYSMQPNPLQYLAYWAGRTRRVDVGTAVIVAPWWNPVRLASEISMLDILLKGRRLHLGIGRGISPHEYASLGYPIGESHAYFYDVIGALRASDGAERFTFDGKVYKIPPTTIRPQARHKGQLTARIKAAFTTEASARMAAENGLGQMFVAGAGLDEMTAQVRRFNTIRAGMGLLPDQPTTLLWMYCAETASEAEAGWEYFRNQLLAAQHHYFEWNNPGYAGIPGYEEYLKRQTADVGVADASLAARRATQPIGTPDEIIEKIGTLQNALSLEMVVIHFFYGGMPRAKAEKSLRLFAEKVLPAVQAMPTPINPASLGGSAMAKFDLIVRGGRVIDPASGIDGARDVAVKDGTIAQVAPRIAGTAARTIDARNRLVIPGMIDTHSHIYQHVTGDFGMNPDEVGVRSGVTAVVDQGGAAPLTIQGFQKFIKDPAATRVYAFVSNYLVGGLLGHRHIGLYGPHGINVRETINAIEKNRDIVKGIKCHAEVGGYSRWGIETLRLAKDASRATRVPVYVHLGRLWAEQDGTTIDPDSVIGDALPLLEPGDILAHPFTKHPGAFVSREGKVHPLIFEAMARGVRIDVGRGGHMSFNAARVALDAGVMPFTIGGDIHGYTIRRRDESSVWGAGAFGGEQGQLTTIGGTGAFSLVQVMNELVALGLGLTDVISMVTVNAASMLGLTDELGSLAPGRVADVSVLAIDEGDWTLQDSLGVRIKTDKRLRPVLALRAGTVHRSQSPLLKEQVPEVA